MRLKLATTTTIMVLLGLADTLDVIDPLVGPKGKTVIAALIGAMQVWVNVISGLSNPDGTDAKAAYIRSKTEGAKQ